MPALQKLQNLCVLKLGFGSMIWEDDGSLDFESDVNGGFRQLKFLELKDLFMLKKWKLSKGVIPSLQKLAVLNCSKLEGLPIEALEAISTLQELVIDEQPTDGVSADAKLIQEHIGKDRLNFDNSIVTEKWLVRL
ncbi:inactive disease susceptibility protein LOV1-like [Macadamia integrifolia]|uniref:inactive disease susceptibility protein LOV1-like n=1 Tax=Macadamia integrifolia TaxID=60698 RepID=UPI001C4F0B70|nr:inactive disease susceptibility protein LOV1-like [Macadamia integrifolia]